MPVYGVGGPPTDFSALTVRGVPIISSGGAPLFTGRWIFADYANGSDGNSGGAGDPVKTITQAYSLMTSGKNDVCVVVSDGTTASTQRLSASLDWGTAGAKNSCHLIGMCSGNAINQRARISHLTTATTNINPLMTVSGADCYFGNFSFFQGIGQAGTDEQLINVTGDRNHFTNVHFGGLGHTNGAARAGSYIIKLNDGDENLFDNCVVGLETVARSAANGSVVLAGGAQRNMFVGCQFMMWASATSPLFVDANSAAALGGASTIFSGCSFTHLLGVGPVATPAVVATRHASANGSLVFDRCTTSATKWAAADAAILVGGYPIGNGFSSGTMVAAADS